MEANILFEAQLDSMKKISIQKSRKSRGIFYINSFFIVLEYFFFMLIFFLLFNWKFDTKTMFIHYYYLLGVLFLTFTFFGIQKGLFKFRPSFGWLEEIFLIFKTILHSFIVTIGLLFLLKTSIAYSRSIVILFFLSMFACSWLLRLLKRNITSVLASRGVYTNNILIVGAGKVGYKLLDIFKTKKELGYNVVGFLDDHRKNSFILGSLSDINSIIHTKDIDEIIITIPSEKSKVLDLLKELQGKDVRIKIIPDLYDLITSKISFEQLNLFPMIEVLSKDKKLFIIVKRLLDIVLSLVGIIITLPVLFTIWISIKVTSRGSPVFKQRRIGKNGVPFNIYKFRTMVSNAEEVLKNNKKLYSKYILNNYKLDPKEDPRITKVGLFLRRTSLDELPQLFNVLVGEMSLVGPRPVVEVELREYSERLVDFLSVKPGVTGYWQVNGRSDIGYPERVDIELYYVYNQSLTLDIKIMIKTVVSVLKKEGAY